jgi:hypothetical protein
MAKLRETSVDGENSKLHIELLELLAEAEDDVKNGRIAPINETFDDLRKILEEE